MAERKQFLREKLLYLREKEKYLWEKEKSLREEKKLKEELLKLRKELNVPPVSGLPPKGVVVRASSILPTLCIRHWTVLNDGREERAGDALMKKLERIENGMYAILWLNFWGELSSTGTSETTEHFRTDLVTYYGDATDIMNVKSPEKPLRCMVTDLRLPGKWITAGHLLPRKDKAKAHVFGIRDINDPRNGLLWFRAIEEAFSLFQIVFSWNADTNTYLIHILDANLCSQKISEVDLRKKVNRSLDHFMDAETKLRFESMRFADLEGKSIVFNNLNRPYKRVLSLHAKLGVHQAKLGGTLPPHLDLDKYNFDYRTEAVDTEVLHTFLKDSQLWIDGKGLQGDEEEGELGLLSPASTD